MNTLPLASLLIWTIALAVIGAVLLRPKGWPEAVWTTLGAVVLVVFQLIAPHRAFAAVREGNDVYLFLAGMMLLSELARREGVFDKLAALAVTAARGSATRLFALVYLVGTLVTIVLSNDATAVVLTPAVYAAVTRARAKPLPYLLICAFIANAASFVLPISNPANLVIYGERLPHLGPWLLTFLLPSCCSILVTYLVLRWALRRDLREPIDQPADETSLSREGVAAAWGIGVTGAILIGASAYGLPLGLPTALSALLVLLWVTRGRLRAIAPTVRDVSWSVLPLVAGLFILVEALNQTGASAGLAWFFQRCATLPSVWGPLAASLGIAGLSNVMNNLPSGLLAGAALTVAPISLEIRNAVLIGVVLGPNLSVTGSLATMLWLIVLRREGQQVGAWQFFKIGLLVMPPALLLATLALALR